MVAEARVFRGANEELEEEVRHDEPVADVGKAVFLLVFREVADGVVAHPFNPAVAIVVHEFGYASRFVGRALQVEEVAQGVAEFTAVEPADDCLGACALRLA